MGKEFSCTSCGVYNCAKRDGKFPKACLTTNERYSKVFESVLKIYKEDPEIEKIAKASAQVEGNYYGKLTRVEEIIVFAIKIGAKKVGIATCMGLINESKIFAKALELNGIEPYAAICKVGSYDKTDMGLSENDKIRPNQHESMCNPIMQAEILNMYGTDLNVIVGLCVGHDALFMKYSNSLVTTLITKDRILAHNPAAALYASGSYYSRIINEKIEIID